jgi:uncharacterized membrane protein
MEEWMIGLIVFACVFGGAILGMLLRSRIPEAHLGDQSKDAVKVGMGLVATMAALVLGLLVASAKNSYDEQRRGLDQISANLILLDSVLAQYGPATQEGRQRLRHVVATGIRRIWPADSSQDSTLAPASTREGENLHSLILRLTPGNEQQRTLQATALQISIDLGRERWLLVAQEEGEPIPALFLAILIFWLTVLFVSIGLFAPSNATVVATLSLSSLSVSAAILLIMELAHPFEGMVQISSEPLRTALSHLAQ